MKNVASRFDIKKVFRVMMKKVALYCYSMKILKVKKVKKVRILVSKICAMVVSKNFR